MTDEETSAYEIFDGLREHYEDQPRYEVREPIPRDADELRWRFDIVCTEDPLKNRMFSVPMEAVQDVSPSEILAVVTQGAALLWWSDHGAVRMHLQYVLANGVTLPSDD